MADNPLYQIYKPKQIQFLPIESDEEEGMYQIAIYGWPFTNLQFYKQGAEYDEPTVTKLVTKIEEDFLDKAVFNPKDWSPIPGITMVSQFADSSSGGNILSDTINVFTNKYSRATEDMLKKYGKYQIKTIKVVRDPVDAPIRKLIDAITSDKEFEYQKLGYDYLFHLYIIIEASYLGNTIYLLSEKRPNIIWEKRKDFETGSGKETQFIKLAVSKDPKSYTINDMVSYAKNSLGKNFNQYDAATNNCQDYILSLVHGIGLAGVADEFIKQPVEDLIKELGPKVTKSGKFLTDVAHFFGRVVGNGVSMRKKSKAAKAEKAETADDRSAFGVTGEKFIKKYGDDIIDQIVIAHAQFNKTARRFITPTQYNLLIAQKSETAVVENIVAVDFKLESGISIASKKNNRGAVDFGFGNISSSYSLTIDIPNEFTLKDALKNTRAEFTDKQYVKNILKNLKLTEYYDYVDKEIGPAYKPHFNYEFDATRAFSKEKLKEYNAEKGKRKAEGIVDPYVNTLRPDAVVDPFRSLVLADRTLGDKSRPVIKSDFTLPGLYYDTFDESERQKKIAESKRKATEARAAQRAAQEAAQEAIPQRPVRPVAVNPYTFGRRPNIITPSRFSLEDAILRPDTEENADDDNADLTLEQRAERGEGISASKKVLAQFLATNTGSVDAIGVLSPNQLYITTDRPYAIVKNKSGLLITPIQNVALTKTMPLTKPIAVKDLLKNVLQTDDKSFVRQILKNVFNSSWKRGGSAQDDTASVSVDILSNVSDLLKEVPEIGDLVDLANEAGDLISKATLATFGIKGPYKQISKQSSLQLLPLNQYSLTDQLIWRVLNVNTTLGTTKRGFSPENYPFLTFSENHPFNIIQDQITAAHGY